MRPWLLVVAVLALAAALIAYQARPPGSLGVVEVTPEATSVSVRVGETLPFAVRAGRARAFTWRVWEREVSHEATFAFVPGPDEVGWQQVSLELSGAGGAHELRTWNVGVVPAVLPEITEVTPPAGPLAAVAGAEARFRCAAHVSAARGEDRIHFQWTVDEQPVRRDEGAADGATSELLWSATPGTHRVAVRVREVERLAALAEWTVEVQPAPKAMAALPPPSALVRPPDVAPRSPPRLVREPDRAAVPALVGEGVNLRVALEPPLAARYRWQVDGRVVQDGAAPLLEYVPEAGRRRVTVTVTADGREIARNAWVVTARAPTPAAEAPEAVAVAPVVPPPATTPPPAPLAKVAPPPAPAAPVAGPEPATLPEQEVRRWLDDYARAWSRKDVETLRRMGQVRSGAEVERLERYFRSIDELRVEVRVLALHVNGERAVVEFERTDTVTDPTGQRRELRLPPFQKQIERTPEGLRFIAAGQG